MEDKGEAMACVWMRGILGEQVCERGRCKGSTEREIVVRKAMGKYRNALRSAKFLGRQQAEIRRGVGVWRSGGAVWRSAEKFYPVLFWENEKRDADFYLFLRLCVV